MTDLSELRDAIERQVQRELGGEVTRLEAIAPGAGTRRFLRVYLRGGAVQSAIARIEMPEDPAGRPPGVPAEPALEPLRSFLANAGLPVPRSYSLSGAIQLLEDAGDVSLEDAASRLPDDERRSLYAEAVQLVPRLQHLSASPQEIPAFGRRLDAALFDYKARLFSEWALPLAVGHAPAAHEIRVVHEAFAWIAKECEAAPARLSHRDFKAANLHVLPTSESLPKRGRLMLIDLQGAFLAPPEYDLMCLLRDSHVAISEPEVSEHLESVRGQLPDAPDGPSFERRFTLLTLTRVGKDLARYLYVARTRNDWRYVPLAPRSVSILRAASSLAAGWSPELTRLAELIHQLPEKISAPPEVRHLSERP